jgi:hypothetical protein
VAVDSVKISLTIHIHQPTGDPNMKLSEIIDALLFAACIGAPFAAFFYFYGV